MSGVSGVRSVLTDTLRAAITDELSGWPIGSGYYQSTVAHDEAREMADALVAALLGLSGVAVTLKPELITTVKQLKALPVRAVIIDAHECVFEHDVYDLWHEPGTEMSGDSGSVVLPARVLWLPDEQHQDPA